MKSWLKGGIWGLSISAFFCLLLLVFPYSENYILRSLGEIIFLLWIAITFITSRLIYLTGYTFSGEIKDVLIISIPAIIFWGIMGAIIGWIIGKIKSK